MADRVTAKWTVDVTKPAAEVFAYLADVSKHGEWSPRPYRVEGTGAGPITAGATFTSYGWIPGDKEHRNDVEATEVDPPHRLVLTAKEPNGQAFVNTFTVTGDGAGCRVERQMDMPTPTGFAGLLFPVFLRLLIRPSVQKGMDMMKRNVEAASA